MGEDNDDDRTSATTQHDDGQPPQHPQLPLQATARRVEMGSSKARYNGEDRRHDNTGGGNHDDEGNHDNEGSDDGEGNGSGKGNSSREG